MRTNRLIPTRTVVLILVFFLFVQLYYWESGEGVKFTGRVQQDNEKLPELAEEEHADSLGNNLYRIQNWIKLPIGLTKYPSLPPLDFLIYGE
jgi:hypothetical protein